MELKEIIELQKEFDSKHKIKFNWAEEISEKNIAHLQFLVLSLAGEVGELANSVKKVVRGDEELETSKVKIAEELTDVFIYVLKLASQMNIALEENYLQKLETNKSRFKPFEM
ncbi:MAG: nucleotide pyrophosphohydrolase [Saprospiraceae bacterium]|nr:nucleotide pyrophosphohydrolase [Saprospiraceae bacterium]